MSIISNKENSAIGEIKYNELKKVFDAETIIKQMNGCLVDIYEFVEQSEYLINARRSEGARIGTWGIIRTVFGIGEKGREEKKRWLEEGKLIETLAKQLNDYIIGEWNPRLRLLSENHSSYFSDKKLRDGHNNALQINETIQNLTIAGKRRQEFTETLQIAGFTMLAGVGIAVGATMAANRAADRQSFRDHFGA